MPDFTYENTGNFSQCLQVIISLMSGCHWKALFARAGKRYCFGSWWILKVRPSYLCRLAPLIVIFRKDYCGCLILTCLVVVSCQIHFRTIEKLLGGLKRPYVSSMGVFLLSFAIVWVLIHEGRMPIQGSLGTVVTYDTKIANAWQGNLTHARTNNASGRNWSNARTRVTECHSSLGEVSCRQVARLSEPIRAYLLQTASSVVVYTYLLYTALSVAIPKTN